MTTPLIAVIVAAVLLFAYTASSKKKPSEAPKDVELNSNTGFAVGDFAVWPGQGVVRVEGARELGGKTYVVMLAVEHGTKIMVPVEKAGSAVRPLVDRAEAERLVEVLRQQSGDSDNRAWGERLHEYMVTLLKRPLEAQAKVLHALYRTAYVLDYGERRLIATFERVVVGELAHVLGKDFNAMVVELKDGQPAFAPTQLRKPAEPAVVAPTAPIAFAKHRYLGKITAPSGRIVVGEANAPIEDTRTAQGKPGDWHAYVKEGAKAHDAASLVLIHTDALGEYDKLGKSLTKIADLNVEGGTMAMISAEVRDSEKVQEAMIFPVSPILEGSGCMVSTHGDGAHRLRGSKVGEEFVALVVDF